MILTELAKVKVAELLDKYKADAPDKDIFLKIGVEAGGCSGLRYQIYFDYNKDHEDHILRYEKFDVRIDKMSWPYLEGATMDFADAIHKQGFSIDNPNSQGSCACGESFH
jgi:iron-sulfur cluster assembly accessory protein